MDTSAGELLYYAPRYFGFFHRGLWIVGFFSGEVMVYVQPQYWIEYISWPSAFCFRRNSICNLRLSSLQSSDSIRQNTHFWKPGMNCETQ